MTPTVPVKSHEGQKESLPQIHELVFGVSLDGELHCDPLIAGLAVDNEIKSAFLFTWSGMNRARHDTPVLTAALTAPDEYTPQWLYIVRDTKDACGLDSVDGEEAMYTRFALHQFDATPTGPVDHNHTTDKAGLLLGTASGDTEGGVA